MAAIPPLHEDPPIGTGNIIPPATPDVAPGEQPPSPPQPGPQPGLASPSLPADWSPVSPSAPPGTDTPQVDDAP